MTCGKSKIILALLALFCLPCTALANAGTPFVWGVYSHLIFGNILIGILEANLLKKLNGNNGWHAVAWMILANYISAFSGCFFLVASHGWFQTWTLNTLKVNALMLAVGLWLVTAVLELPFVWLAMGRENRNWCKALKCSFIMQSFSYILLILWYMFCGNNSLLTCRIVEPGEIELPNDSCIYYIGAYDNKVYKWHSAKQTFEIVSEQTLTGERVRLFALQKTPDDMKPDLVAVSIPFGGSAQQTLILPQFADAAKVILEPSDVDGKYNFSSFYWFSRTLGDAKQSNCRFEAPPLYPDRGLSLFSRLGKGEKDTDYYNKPDRYGFNRSEWKREKRVLALASPLAVWSIHNPIQFSNDVVLIEMSYRQLCLFDYRTRRIALLARGYGATAAIEEDSTKDHE